MIASYDQEVARNNGTPNYQQLKTAVKFHIDPMMRNRNFRAQNDVMERGQLPRVEKETKHASKGKWESVFSGKHTDNVPVETQKVSVMTHSPRKKRERSVPHPSQRQNGLTARNEKASQGLGNKEENSREE